MSDTWIGRILLTNENAIYKPEDEKAFDLLLCDGSSVDQQNYPLLYAKMATLPNMTPPTGSPWPYKIIADAT